MADQTSDLMPDRGDLPYQVSVHTEQCHDEREARNFTVNILLSVYLNLVYPRHDGAGQRMFCASWSRAAGWMTGGRQTRARTVR